MAFDLHAAVPSAARTTSGNSGAIAVQAESLGIGLNVTAVTGTSPSMTVTVEWSYDGTNFAVGETTDSFAAITAAKVTNRLVSVRAPYYRLVWAITGTSPSFTYPATTYTY
jgi:hypothetical protein